MLANYTFDLSLVGDGADLGYYEEDDNSRSLGNSQSLYGTEADVDNLLAELQELVGPVR